MEQIHVRLTAVGVMYSMYFFLLVSTLLWKQALSDDPTKVGSTLVVKTHGLPPGPKQLQHMIVDDRTGNIFIGATNTIFVRDSELNPIKKIAIGPFNDSLYCPPNPAKSCQCPYNIDNKANLTVNSDEGCGDMSKRELTDNIVKNLVLDKEVNQLIVCTNLYYGYCSKVSLSDYTVHQIFIPVVSNALTAESVVLVAESAGIPNALYVGASRDLDNGLDRFKDQSHMLAVREPESFDIAHYDDIYDSVSFIDVKKELRDKFPVNFKYSFSYNGYSYFLLTRAIKPSINRTATFIVRICHDDPRMRSYVEFRLYCEDKSRNEYNSVISAYITQVGTDLATDLQAGKDNMLFVLFGLTLPDSFTVGSEQTQLCVYSLREIESMFTEAVRFCFSGIGGMTGPEHITEPKECKKMEFELCGKSADNWPVLGRREIEPKTSYHFSGERLTSLAVKRTEDRKYTVGYLGNKIGQLKKVIFESRKDVQEFGVQTLGGDGRALMKDLFFDKTKTYLYAMNDQQVFKVQLFNCSIHTDCDSCLDANEPQCGWCILENKCTEKAACQLGSTSYGWLSYKNPACHAITMTTPEKISFDEVTQTEILLKMNTVLPSEITMLPLLCEMSYGEFTEKSETMHFLAGVNCTPFSKSPELSSNESVDLIEPDIWIQVLEQRWIKKKVVIFDCSRRTSCSSCVGRDLPCLWCSLTSQCLHKRQACFNSSAILSPASSEEVLNFSAADRVGSQFCPAVLPLVVMDNDYLVASGNPKQIKVQTRQIFDYHQKNMKCLFDFNDGQTVEASYNSGDKTITCQSATFEYEEEVGSVHVPVKFFWENTKILDNPDNIAVEVYKCGQLAQTCGECTLLRPVYRCGWCEDKCTLPEYCVSPSDSRWLGRDQTCPNPTISKFYPNSGPILGGTNVTIEGVNLGKKFSDVRNNVFIAGVRCDVIQQLYEPPNKLVCTTKGANVEKSGPVKVTVAGQEEFTATSAEIFFFRISTTVQFEPLKGPVSGGTIVTVSGQFLDMGSHVTVRINDRKCKVLRRESKSLEFETSAQPAAISDTIRLEFDGTEDSLSNKFAFIEDPRVTAVYPDISVLSGGATVHVNGSDLDSALTPVFYLKKDGILSETMCEIISPKSLDCPLPDLTIFELDPSFEEPSSLSYGFRIDGWHADLTELSYDLDLDLHPMKILPDPVVHMFEDANWVKPFLTDRKSFEILGEHLDVFEKVPGLIVKVGNSSCEILEISPDVLIVAAPENPSIINEDGNSKVEVILGKFEAVVGYIQYSSPQDSRTGLIVGIIFGVIITLLIVVMVLLFLRYRKRRAKKHGGSPAHLHKDNGVVERSNIYAGAANHVETSEAIPLKEMGGLAGATGGGHDDDEEEEVDTDKPFELSDFLERIRDPKLRASVQEVIVPNERLDMQEMIGRGNFGCVYMASLKADHDDNKCRVAVKTLQGERLEQHTVEAFLKEGVIMKNFNHPHVLRLLGVCVNNQENPMVILPYMANGDLRSYVKDKKKNFTARQLLHLAQQVAEGMTYLSSLNFVHRDLAARNCMIDEFDVVKVADFGLTRDLFEKQYFSTNLKEKRGKMPIKWMALESLEEFVFTTKSDVWSFGVLMWELMTRGVTPYPDVDIFDVRNYLASGRRLRKPKYCPDNIYNIMLACWHADSDMRPNFINLVNRVELLLNPPKRRIHSEEDSGEPMYMNIRKANSSEYLKPLDGSTSEELLSDNSTQANVVA